jgi:hypothetical protein
MLNPSVADADIDDPTIGRCISFATREGYGGIVVINMFAYRATNPDALIKEALDPIGPDNESTIEAVLTTAGFFGVPILCAWGANHMAVNRQAEHLRILKRFPDVARVCLGLTVNGCPRHPLYMPGDQEFVPFSP